MPKPNFFIIGAPKCGTSSLAAWLGAHPEACMSRPKEPHFFYPREKSEYPSVRDYEACFAHAGPGETAIGEASTNTMYSSEAIGRILDYAPEAKFILCLRNPVEMALSLHNHIVNSEQQPIKDFVEAWTSDATIYPRFQDGSFESRRYYREMCALGSHLERLRALLPDDRLITVLLEDIAGDEAAELGKIAAFLGISRVEAPYPRSNVVKHFRSRLFRYAVRGLVRSKRALGVERSFGIGNWLNRLNIREGVGTASMTPAIYAMLARHFEPEIGLLEQQLGRDLSHWRMSQTPANAL